MDFCRAPNLLKLIAAGRQCWQKLVSLEVQLSKMLTLRIKNLTRKRSAFEMQRTNFGFDHVTFNASKKQIMNDGNLLVLSFVGGPFDGFDELVAPDEVLPECIDLPMNSEAAKIFGMRFCNSDTPRFAVYRLDNQEDMTCYRFHRMRVV